VSAQGEFDFKKHYYRTGLPSVPGDTSEGAAESMEDSVEAIRRRVCFYIIDKGDDGATCDETEEALDLVHQTCSPRITELRLGHMIEDSGARRLTRSNRRAIVWTKFKGKPQEETEWLM
jgi:hypothetical protein